ncbi:transcriptional regulator [Bifidobacterium animalis subsp. animalis]|uniref:transcriptional regulator n=1 Tax=Bifidobacterium animalis TaxID=28025 RepID=UPI00101FFDA9|nr:transcriptional regulator [Bifidobacterium animalis]RYN14133.1 transcriptional regulator [Bifidobacterium animalis subsp. animalis]
MSRNTDDRRALAAIESERMEDQIAYYRKPFMVLWAAVQEASAELEEDYGLSSDVSQLWVAERLRQVSDSLVDRLAEKAVQHGTSKSNVARAADSNPTNAMRRFPRLRPGADRTRLLIDEVLDSLE